MTRLARKEWNELDRLLELHELGNYYDFLARLQYIASCLGFGNVGYDIEETFKDLPAIIDEIESWSSLLSSDKRFRAITEELGAKVAQALLKESKEREDRLANAK